MTQDLPSEDASKPRDDAPEPAQATDAHPPRAVDTLRQAMRRARQDNAERAGALAELRSARLGRLELLQEALKPLFAQIPDDIDTFDIGLTPGANPRLFIDMIGFVEMGRDARLYRLLQDSRHGRSVIAESEDLDTIVDAVTDYVARRLLERDKALAADARRRPAAAQRSEPANLPAKVDVPAPRPRRRRFRWLAITFAFVIDLLGSIAFFTLLAMVAWYAWNRLHTPL